ncbi:MAG: alpha/beta fold hydrolase [Proteobacteria bacterium]|nr:alpha/beta fold hydrolase [Pseudomonadota bacterium]
MDETTKARVPVIFLHGIGGAAPMWAPQLDAFKRGGFEPVALDLPGYGSRTPISHMDFELLAGDVESTVESRELVRPVLLGHSLGGMIAQTALRRRPLAYRAAVLCCTSAAFGEPGGEFQRKFIADRLDPLERGMTLAALAPSIVDQISCEFVEPELRALAIDLMGRVPRETYCAAVRCVATFDERANLANIAVPVLCVSGENDGNAPAPMMARMAKRIAGARHVCLSGVGHLATLENPAAFNSAIIDFLHDVLE